MCCVPTQHSWFWVVFPTFFFPLLVNSLDARHYESYIMAAGNSHCDHLPYIPGHSPCLGEKFLFLVFFSGFVFWLNQAEAVSHFLTPEAKSCVLSTYDGYCFRALGIDHSSLKGGYQFPLKPGCSLLTYSPACVHPNSA